MFKNTASQKLTVFAFADAGHATLDAGEPVTGDAANITMKVEQDDDGTQSASNDTNPTEVEDGQYRFDLTQAETNGDKLTFYPESSTAGVQVVAMPSNVIYTRPANFPDAFADLVAGVITGTVGATSLTTTTCSSDLTHADDFLIGRTITFLTGTAAGQQARITDFANTNGVITFTEIDTAPAENDTFKIT